MSIITAVLNKGNNRKEAKRFIKFSIVGGFGALIDFSLLSILIFWLGWGSILGKLMANVISTGVAILSNFTWNRLWTFPESRNRKKRVQLIQFTIVNLIGLLLNTGIFVATDYLLFSPLLKSASFYDGGVFRLAPFQPEALAVQLAKATAIGLVLFWNFGANRLWTYRGL